MSTATQPEITALLEQVGARPRGGRHDCPDCGSHRSVTVNEAKQVFCCHHAGCNFHGGLGALRKRLGIEREWLPRDQYVRQKQECERAHEAAKRLCHAVHGRRMELLEDLHNLNRLEALAHDEGPTEGSWKSLALVYRERPRIESELDFLESASAADIARYFGVVP